MKIRFAAPESLFLSIDNSVGCVIGGRKTKKNEYRLFFFLTVEVESL